MGKPNNNGNGDTSQGKVFSADVVAALLMSLNTTSISMRQYELMSAMDGIKTASAFQHDFRSVLAKARELKTRIDNGETFSPVRSVKKRGASTMDDSKTAPPVMLGKKHKGNERSPVTPIKMAKAIPKPRGKKAKEAVEEDEPTNDLGDAVGQFPEEMEEIIKQEKDWEDGFGEI